MPSSDAYMELSDPDVWGETYDEQFGMGAKGRKLGAFEIAKFSFDISSESDDDTDKKSSGSDQQHHGHARHGHGQTHGHGTSTHKEHKKEKFTISKFIDKASPDLFLSCCKKNKIHWAIISVRETGEVSRKPYLVMEFTGLHVMSFKWDLSPGDSGDEASQMETVEFDFETILIKYSRQEVTGEHRVVKLKGWNYKKSNDEVTELDAELQAAQIED